VGSDSYPLKEEEEEVAANSAVSVCQSSSSPHPHTFSIFPTESAFLSGMKVKLVFYGSSVAL
jgi:hypothetical protein